MPIREFKTACQQACDSDSLVFGDINDPKSRVARLRNSDRGLRDAEVSQHDAARHLSRAHQESRIPKMPGADKVGMANGAPHHGGATGKNPTVRTRTEPLMADTDAETHKTEEAHH